MKSIRFGLYVIVLSFSVLARAGIECESYYHYVSKDLNEDTKVASTLKVTEDKRGFYVECDKGELICPAATLRKTGAHRPGDITQPGFVMELSYVAPGKEVGHTLAELWLDALPAAGQIFQLRSNLMDLDRGGYKYKDGKGRQILWAMLTCKVL